MCCERVGNAMVCYEREGCEWVSDVRVCQTMFEKTSEKIRHVRVSVSTSLGVITKSPLHNGATSTM